MADVLQFRIELLEVSPPVWRRIQVPSTYSFWDLHVAIQDAMGWTDSHLHAFRIGSPADEDQVEIGIPDPDGEYNVVPGWEREVTRHFVKPRNQVFYEYDFGDSWQHAIVLERILAAEPTVTYPCCLDGERRCPPEDVGGPDGFEDFLDAINDPDHEEHESYLEWCGGSFDPDEFDSNEVIFDDPQERLRWLDEDEE